MRAAIVVYCQEKSGALDIWSPIVESALSYINAVEAYRIVERELPTAGSPIGSRQITRAARVLLGSHLDLHRKAYSDAMAHALAPKSGVDGVLLVGNATLCLDFLETVCFVQRLQVAGVFVAACGPGWVACGETVHGYTILLEQFLLCYKRAVTNTVAHPVPLTYSVPPFGWRAANTNGSKGMYLYPDKRQRAIIVRAKNLSDSGMSPSEILADLKSNVRAPQQYVALREEHIPMILEAYRNCGLDRKVGGFATWREAMEALGGEHPPSEQAPLESIA